MKKDRLREEYEARINRTFDYIENNLEKPITLSELADVSNFSKFHFHRIFQGLVRETPFQFITRVRLERAATFLEMNPNDSITEIAFRCGFNDISIFSRNFKKQFKLSATDYRNQKSNLSQLNSKNHQEEDKASMYFCFNTNQVKWRTTMKLNKSVEVKKLPKMTVAYVRHIGPYQGDEQLFESLWNELFTWAGPRGLIGGPDFKSLIIYHDDPGVTNEEKLRTSVCITVPKETKVDGKVGKMEIDETNYVIAEFDLKSDEFGEAWEWVYGQWFPSSGYQPDDHPCFEMYPEEPKDGRFTVDICVPVKPV